MARLGSLKNWNQSPRTARSQKRIGRHGHPGIRRAGHATIETLEERRLMSMTIELLDANGGTSSQVTTVGQVVNLNVWAYIKGTNNNPAEDTVQDVSGAFIGNLSSPGAVGGTLQAANFGEFDANGSTPGVQQDLNGDGHLDDGSASTTEIHDYFFARASVEEGNGTSVNGGLMIQVGTVSYTVTTLGGGAPTKIVFRVPPGSIGVTNVWDEDDQAGGSNNLTNTYAGSAYTIEDSALIVPPVANNDTVTDYRNQTTTISPLANDTEDLAYNLSSFTITSNPTHGNATANADGTVTYTPSSGYIGGDSFSYKISDDAGNTSNLATVTINVTAPPPPTAVADTATTTRQIATNIAVLADDTFPTPAVDSSVTVTTQPANGTVAVNTSNGSIEYTPTGLFVGTDTFQYTVADSDGETSAAATVTVTVVPPAAPVAVNQSVPVVENTTHSINVSTGATTVAGTIDPTTVLLVTGPAHGTATVQTSTGAVLYTPTPGYVGSDSLTYTVDDTDGDVSNVATVALTVLASTPPTAVDSTASTQQNQAIGINVATNDVASTDGGLDPSTILITTPPVDGTAYLATSTVTINTSLPNLTQTVAAGQIVYVPNPTFFGTDTFSYTIGDGYGSTSTPATVTIAVNKAAAPTVATTVPVNSTLSGAAVTLNASAGVSTTIPLTATGTTVTVTPLDGTATVNTSTGSILYTPKAGFVGTDSVTYTVTDIDGQVSAPVTESVNVGTMLTTTVKGSPRTLVFTDAAGGKETLSLNSGQTEIFFSGTGSVTTKGTTVTATGTSLEIGSITLTGTTARSSLSIRGSAKTPVTIGDITDTAPLGSIIAPSATLTGTATLASVSNIQLLALTGATLTTTGSVKTPLTINIPTGTASTITTTQAIKSFKANTWATDTTASITSAQITAPVINSLTIGSSFGGTVTANTTAGSLVFRGTLTGMVNAGAAKLVEVIGNVTNGGIRVSTANAIVVTGTVSGGSAVTPYNGVIDGSDYVLINNAFNNQYQLATNVSSTNTGPTISSSGNVGSLTVGYLSATSVEIGSTPTATVGATTTTYSYDTTLLNVSSLTIGTATLNSFRVTGRSTGGIANSSVLAGTIKSASVGVIGVGNNGVPQGIAAAHFGTVSGVFADRPLSLPAKETASATTLTAYLKTKGYTLGDFEIDVLG